MCVDVIEKQFSLEEQVNDIQVEILVEGGPSIGDALLL